MRYKGDAKGIALIIGQKFFHFGKDPLKLWWDGSFIPKEDKLGNYGWGFVFAIRWGFVIKPIPKLWMWKSWKPAWPNPWKEDHWFVFKLPFLIFPFFSAAYKTKGIYLGIKDYPLNNPYYKSWLPEEYRGDQVALGISGSIRNTRVV